MLSEPEQPKWGFLPLSQHLSVDTKVAKTTHCRFCMMNWPKRQGKATENRFCPLDLYSGDELRVKRGLSALWASWISSNGSINNLRVFVGGAQVHPDDVRPSTPRQTKDPEVC